MPKKLKMKKPRMIRIKGTKEKKEKDPNKIKQSVKINISTSGGGSGGATIPTIPNPIYNSMQGQKTGENVETHNLLKQLIKTQIQATPIQTIPTTKAIPIFDDNYIPQIYERNLRDYKGETLLQKVNRDNNIDNLEDTNVNNIEQEAQFVNADNEEEISIYETQKNELLKGQQKEINKANENLNIPIPIQQDGPLVKEGRKKSNLPIGVYLSSNGGRFVAKFRGHHIGTYDSPDEAAFHYDKFKNEN